MNWSDLFAAVALYLILEGILPFLSPQGDEARDGIVRGHEGQSPALVGADQHDCGIGAALFGSFVNRP